MTKELLNKVQTFAQQQRMFDMQQRMGMANQIQTSKIINVVDQVLSENVQLKKKMNLDNIQNQKNQTINSARTQPVDLMQRRTGKKKGGSVKNKRKNY